MGQFKKVIWITIIGNIVGLFVSLVLVINYKILGALLAIVITPALLFFVNVYFINKEISFLDSIHMRFFDSKISNLTFQVTPSTNSQSIANLLGYIFYYGKYT